MKAALYARVSTSDKEQNPENQLIRLREYAQRQGWDFEELPGEFASAATLDRPIFEQLLDRCRRREFDAIVIVRLDRMMRNLQTQLQIMEELETRGVRLVCLDQPIDTGSAAGRFQLQMLAAVAEFERGTMVERILDGIARAKRQGTRSGKPIGRPRIPEEGLSPAARRKRLSRLRIAAGTSPAPESSGESDPLKPELLSTEGSAVTNLSPPDSNTEGV